MEGELDDTRMQLYAVANGMRFHEGEAEGTEFKLP